MAVRLKYAMVPEDRIVVESDPRRAISQALERAAPGETIYVLPTYTAMLELREVLRQDGHVAGFWQD
jgi:UDP-N-acetylmuramyl tripeptide synthase